MDRSAFILYKSNMLHIPASRAIRTYNLFGEDRDLPDVVHCETIAARSALHGWKIAPHRHARLHQLLLIERGGGEATLEGRNVRLTPMRILNLPTGHVHGFAFIRSTQGWVLTIAAEMLDEVLLASEGLPRVLAQAAMLRGTPPMRALMRQIFSEFAGRGFARAHVLRSLTTVLIGLVARAMAAKREPPPGTAGADLFARFEALLEAHVLEHWSVARYAVALAITPTHLSRITRDATGHAASQLIAERLVREARRNLVYTNLPISTVAFALGFEDPAYFSRVFARATGQSPRAFRQARQS
ncbi:MAG: helix-turn-helix domain-containing protein [Alphaproteobacteria bacterium]|nr:helix-turn-helix domain-containing protein [Alphaproteobacteria bacterium]